MITQLHVIEDLSAVGGTPRKLLSLVKHSDPATSSFHFLCFRDAPLAPQFTEHKAQVRVIESSSPLAISEAVTQAVIRHGCDVICTHFTRSLVAGCLSAGRSGVPVIHHVHGSAREWGLRKRLLEGLFMKCVDKVICNSEYTRHALRQWCGVSQGRMAVLANPVERRPVTEERCEVRRHLGWEDGTLVIGHVGGMIELRDQKTLFHSLAALLVKGIDCGLIMIGDGPLRSNLEKLAEQLQVRQRIRFLGYTDRIGDYLSAMDLYVSTARSEGFGIAVCEAMLAGLPVVLADGGAHPELIDDGESGLLFGVGDVEALTERVVQLATDFRLRSRLGEHARQRAELRFSPDTFARCYTRIVDDVVLMRLRPVTH